MASRRLCHDVNEVVVAVSFTPVVKLYPRAVLNTEMLKLNEKRGRGIVLLSWMSIRLSMSGHFRVYPRSRDFVANGSKLAGLLCATLGGFQTKLLGFAWGRPCGR